MTNKTNQFNEDYQKMMDDLDDQVLQEVRQTFRRLKKLGHEPRVIFDVGASNSGWSCYIKRILPISGNKVSSFVFDSIRQTIPIFSRCR